MQVIIVIIILSAFGQRHTPRCTKISVAKTDRISALKAVFVIIEILDHS